MKKRLLKKNSNKTNTQIIRQTVKKTKNKDAIQQRGRKGRKKEERRGVYT